MIHPLATENISPVLSEHFAFTRSAQNALVIVGTGGVTRYVVKVSLSAISVLRPPLIDKLFWFDL
jgi:hypothetical protein